MLLGAVDVIGRYFFNAPLTGGKEVSEVLLAGVVFFSLAYTQQEKAHINVTLVYTRFPKKMRTIVGILNSIIALVLFSLITWQSIKWAIVYWNANKLIDVIFIPIAPFQLFVSLGAFTICLIIIVQLVQYATELGKES
jgi:TRAP-type C4-dicarboxylate transport system permease small subunit